VSVTRIAAILRLFLPLAFVAAALPVLATPQAAAPAVLPENFGGWQLATREPAVSDPKIADPAEAPLLTEYGFQGLEAADYEQNGRHLKLKALRFHDATGALGAFLYYRQPQMNDETIGDLASSNNEHVIFYRANIVVQAVFDKLTAMSAAQLRELASMLPVAGGSDAKAADLPNYLSHTGQIANSTRYAEGPVGLDRIGAPVKADLVDFASGAEVVLSKYEADPGDATVTLIEYPTPQLATDHLKRIEDAHKMANAQQNPNGPALINLEQIYTRRTGPIVIIVSGLVTPNAVGKLLHSVNYDAEVTWNERWTFSKNNNLGYLMLNIFALAAVLMVLALVFGVGFGFLRVFASRMFPKHVRSAAEGQEFISLHLDGPSGETPKNDASGSR